jgi:hypothetical protein
MYASLQLIECNAGEYDKITKFKAMAAVATG